MQRDIDLSIQNLIVPKRIDAYLAEALLKEYSREEIKRCLVAGTIFLNDHKAKPRDLVKNGDHVHGNLMSEKKAEMIGENIPLSVLYEDESLLVVDKPVGLVVHPGAGNKTGTLVNALLGRKTPLSSLSGAERPGIVHRLDKDTSGLLLVAKNNNAHRKLQSQFAERSLSKTYLALVRGRLDYEEGHLKVPIGRDPKVRQKMNITREGSGREALTHYRVLERFRYATLLAVKLVTGRTHQIRVHMQHLGHPVVGDSVYGGLADAKEPRLALHAWKIEFLHPKTGKMMKFESSVPKEMKSMIEKAKNQHEKR